MQVIDRVSAPLVDTYRARIAAKIGVEEGSRFDAVMEGRRLRVTYNCFTLEVVLPRHVAKPETIEKYSVMVANALIDLWDAQTEED